MVFDHWNKLGVDFIIKGLHAVSILRIADQTLNDLLFCSYNFLNTFTPWI